MTQVNSPFLLPKLRPINELSSQQNNYLEQLERVVQQIYRRVGGEIDNVQSGALEASSNEDQVAILRSRINQVDNRLYDILAEDSSYLEARVREVEERLRSVEIERDDLLAARVSKIESKVKDIEDGADIPVLARINALEIRIKHIEES